MNAFMAAIAGPAKISSPILPKPSVTRAIVEKSSQPQQAEGMLNVCCQDSRLLRLYSSPDSQSNMTPPLGGGDRKSVVEGKSVSVRVDNGGRRIIKKKKRYISK